MNTPAVIKFTAPHALHTALKAKTWAADADSLITSESFNLLCPITWMLPIHLAAQYGHLQAMMLLVEAGANIDHPTQGVSVGAGPAPPFDVTAA